MQAKGVKEKYAILAEHGIGNYIKYNTVHQEQVKHRSRSHSGRRVVARRIFSMMPSEMSSCVRLPDG